MTLVYGGYVITMNSLDKNVDIIHCKVRYMNKVKAERTFNEMTENEIPKKVSIMRLDGRTKKSCQS